MSWREFQAPNPIDKIDKIDKIDTRGDIVDIVYIVDKGDPPKKLKDNRAEGGEWTPKEQALIDWFLTTELPKEPFLLSQGVYIQDTQKFYAALRGGIQAGRTGPRARTGALQNDLRQLKAH
jgi:hypothetical protein